MSLHELLDLTLKYVNSIEDDRPKTEGEIKDGLLNMVGLDLSLKEVAEVMSKLQKDGYAEPYKPAHAADWVGTRMFISTFEGKVFMNDGGYIAKINRLNSDSIRLAAVEERQRANARQTTFLTVILTAATIPTGLAAILEIAKDKNIVLSIEMMAALSIFTFGVISGIIIYMLISEGFNNRKQS